MGRLGRRIVEHGRNCRHEGDTLVEFYRRLLMA
jgi:hypothetical protein